MTKRAKWEMALTVGGICYILSTLFLEVVSPVFGGLLIALLLWDLITSDHPWRHKYRHHINTRHGKLG